MTTKRPWTSAALIRQRPHDLAECHTTLERQLCAALCDREIEDARKREELTETLNRALPVVADSWDHLRRCDIYRLLSVPHYDGPADVYIAAGIIGNRRPEFAATANADAADYIQDAQL